ncbi:hypothetical protein D3C72_2395660 [compost metagenome]
MTKGWPSFSLSGTVSMRAMASLEPPGGNGTTTDTGRCGHSCGAAYAAALTVRAATVTTEPSAKARSQ